MTNHSIKVVELFAGVGGFRLGLENASPEYKVIWANQWEPNKNKQHAFDCYIKNFSSGIHINQDISIVKDEVPKHDLLVGGFPCQDYSVARTGAQGIEGKKGVLWWDIEYIVKNNRPKYILLENVDRLLKSPSKQRGRDFAIILSCLNRLNYVVEWRVINAAEYGYAQRRRRVFILAYLKDSPLGKNITLKSTCSDTFLTSVFPIDGVVDSKKQSEFKIEISKDKDLLDISNNFTGLFYNSGIAIDGNVISVQSTPTFHQPKTLRDIIEKEKVDEKYFISDNQEKWIYLKGAKRIERTKPNGEKYFFSEGGMAFPDSLDLPARTMLTSESNVNRSTHVIRDLYSNRLRLLTPIECERLNGFPDNWTETGMPHKFRYFSMGNALVVPIIEQIGKNLLQWF